MHIQALGSANLGINQFGGDISFSGQGNSQVSLFSSKSTSECSVTEQLQNSGFLSQSQVVYTPLGGQRSEYNVKSKSISKSSDSKHIKGKVIAAAGIGKHRLGKQH